ncbi:hypothetical protein [Cellulomonas shaoxiangyii]|uniref:LPXTG cell wall anchor domain-containing protein n=1 Tax=Cellulomonas shaoxiangyii TaxID=2566013 RepID=A0A4P7SGZ4_9CELL|nr:hypothetical protein [Cellulomonas shaoxiangyii]QCB92928.1 hypothetical protein E5225_04505 [Cellulomonas shaoxiangyii]TGY85384.1 hypothetical protein E5226_06740 [Cellulomonas shaoxiangyii]
MRRRWVAAAVLAAGFVTSGAGAADAAGVDDALGLAWEGPTVALAWDGTAHDTVTTSFVGSRVAVPGDVVGRTLTVRNDGPTDATLRGWVTDVALLDPAAPDVDHATGEERGDFYADLRLRWRAASGDGTASFRELAVHGRTEVVSVPLARGETTRITLVSELPVGARSGNGANVAPREARFDVLLRLDGSASPVPAAGVTSVPAAAAVTAPGGGAGARTGGVGGPLATTGADALRAALAAVVAVGVGGLLLGAVRRRREEP